MSDETLVRTLGEVDLFHGLSHKVLAHIADSGHEAHYDAGDASSCKAIPSPVSAPSRRPAWRCT